MLLQRFAAPQKRAQMENAFWARARPFCISVPARRPTAQGYWRNRKRACLASTRYWDRNPDTPAALRYGVVGNISACHADARGSIPRFGVFFFRRAQRARPERVLHLRVLLGGGETRQKHTFSAFWLRSSVVSVLISLISGTWRMASHEFK